MWAKLGPSCSLSCPALPPFPLPVTRGPFVVVVGGGLLGPSLLSFFLTLLFLLTLRPVVGHVHTSEYSPTLWTLLS